MSCPGRMHRLRRRGVVEVGEQAPANDPPMPSALAVIAGSKPASRQRRRAAEDAADRPSDGSRARESARGGHADPRDDLVAGDDRRQQLGVRLRRSPRPAASAAGQTTTLTCETESECVSSKSSPWQSMPLPKAAAGAGSARSRPITVACGSAARLGHRGPALASRCRGRSRRGRSRGCRAGGASRHRATSAGMSSKVSVVANSARRSAAFIVTPSSRRRSRGTRPQLQERRACRP